MSRESNVTKRHGIGERQCGLDAKFEEAREWEWVFCFLLWGKEE